MEHVKREILQSKRGKTGMMQMEIEEEVRGERGTGEERLSRVDEESGGRNEENGKESRREEKSDDVETQEGF